MLLPQSSQRQRTLYAPNGLGTAGPTMATSLHQAHQYAQTISRSSDLGQYYQMLRSPIPLPVGYYDGQSNGTVKGRKHRSSMDAMLHASQHFGQQPLSLALRETQMLPGNRPLCRCRVIYLGSSVPHITKNGLHGIQEPLRHLYPEEQFLRPARKPSQSSSQAGASPNTIDISHLSSSLGIDSWLSVWSNGMLLENVDEFGKDIRRFFAIESLHYCAAVRFFDTSNLTGKSHPDYPTAADHNNNSNPIADLGASDGNNNNINAIVKDEELLTGEPGEELAREQLRRKRMVRFLPLDAPIFQWPGMVDANHPPVFAAIMRRTTGIKVLECHAFICRRDAAANALVRCCTHAYADSLSARRLSLEMPPIGAPVQPSKAFEYATTMRPRSAAYRSATMGRGRMNGGNSFATDEAGKSSPSYEGIVVEATINGAQAGAINGNAQTDVYQARPDDEEIDENYAIIAKSPKGSRANDDTGAKVVAREQSKGSSKSLFNDFMPQVSDTYYADGQSKKLTHSHSLDPLEAAAAANGAQTKRHSKSMQNLESSQFLASNSSSIGSSRSRRGHRHRRRILPGSDRSNRRSNSFQDMSSLNYQTKPAASSSVNPDECKQSPAKSDKRSHALAEPAGECRVLRPEQQSSRSKSSSRRRDRQIEPSQQQQLSRQRPRDLHLYDQPSVPVQTPPMGLNSYQPQQPSNYKSPVIYAAPTTQLQHPLYMPAYPQAMYGSSPIYDSSGPLGYYLPGAPIAPHLAHLPYPMYHGGQTVAMNGVNPTLAAGGVVPQASRKSRRSAKATLARFRCLSPPINFLSHRSEEQQQAGKEMKEGSKAAPKSETQQPDSRTGQPEQAGQPQGQRDPKEEEAQMALGKVVTAAPGFLARSARPDKKMSWIKRLSLTMGSSTLTENPMGNLAADGEQVDPAEQQQTSRQRKKRSSLFSGSLTLGRSNKAKQMLESG